MLSQRHVANSMVLGHPPSLKLVHSHSCLVDIFSGVVIIAACMEIWLVMNAAVFQLCF